MSEAKIEKLEVGDRTVTINPENLRFNEATLNQYIQTEAGHYDNFGACLALAEKLLQREEMLCEKVYSERFAEAKDHGASDKKAEAMAKADDIVIDYKERIIDAKYKVQRLKRHLYAWDKNHDNAQSLGHMLRKEMDKLNAEIFSRSKQYDFEVDRDHSSFVSSPAPSPEDFSSSSDDDGDSGGFDSLDRSNLY